ncbi:MAG TPA: hypothetical protein PKY59_03855 [Pyrinomonadaceae bacterium]|nr:hypothetical protein [Pyrinomonadaceae bacterium]
MAERLSFFLCSTLIFQLPNDFENAQNWSAGIPACIEHSRLCKNAHTPSVTLKSESLNVSPFFVKPRTTGRQGCPRSV